MQRAQVHKKIHIQIASLVLLGSALGLLYNGFSENGLPLVASEPPRLRIPDPLGRDILKTYEAGFQEVLEIWQKGQGLFLDSREKAKYVKDHLPLALSVPYDEFEESLEKLDPLLREKIFLIIYCDGADCDSSILLAQKILDAVQGEFNIYNRLKIFYDGWNLWLKAGLETEKGEMD